MDLEVQDATLRVAGQVDVRCLAELRDALHELLRSRPEDCVLDLSDVESVDLTALRMIAVASRVASRQGHRLTVRGCSPLVRRLLHLAHLRGHVRVEGPRVSA
jgi:anti-anti-sigma factor